MTGISLKLDEDDYKTEEKTPKDSFHFHARTYSQ